MKPQKRQYYETTKSSVRLHLFDCFDAVSVGGQRLLVTEYGRPIAAIVSIADLEKLVGQSVRPRTRL